MSNRIIPIPRVELAVELSNSNKSADSAVSSNNNGSPLKRAIKENENAIIQLILASKTDGSGIQKGMTPLLDHLFEDGQLTRAEYDFLDKAHGMQTAQEQVQALLRILTGTKVDEALEVLLRYLEKLDPSSDAILKLCANFLRNQDNQDAAILCRKGGGGELISRFCITGTYLSFKFASSKSTSRFHQDFYYGRNFCENTNKDDIQDADRLTKDTGSKSQGRYSINKPVVPPKEITDFRDFFLTNGCLESVRNLITESCRESLTSSGWEGVLRNMNGLLTTDVLTIKDLLFQIKCLDHQSLLEEERLLAQEVERIDKERQQQLQFQESALIDFDSNAYDNVGSRESQIGDNSLVVNWNQIVYHSLQVWKQRNGLNSTFYSLIGVFQHSNLNQTADFLLANKMEIQARETEKDIEPKKDIDVSRALPPTTMLEKSDFLRKFYTPAKDLSGNNGTEDVNGKSSIGSLTTTKDRVSVSPVLSLDLL